MSEDNTFWTTEWILTEKILSIGLLAILLKVTTGWDKVWTSYGIGACAFMATYSLMNTYKVWPTEIHDYKLVGIFIGYSFILFILLSLRR